MLQRGGQALGGLLTHLARQTAIAGAGPSSSLLQQQQQQRQWPSAWGSSSLGASGLSTSAQGANGYSAPYSGPRGEYHATTILCVRKEGMVVMIGDGQVSMGNMVAKRLVGQRGHASCVGGACRCGESYTGMCQHQAQKLGQRQLQKQRKTGLFARGAQALPVAAARQRQRV